MADLVFLILYSSTMHEKSIRIKGYQGYTALTPFVLEVCNGLILINSVDQGDGVSSSSGYVPEFVLVSLFCLIEQNKG